MTQSDRWYIATTVFPPLAACRQVCTLLAKMQACGVACAPSVLAAHRPILASRLAAIKGAATQLVGRDFNLSSSSQLAKVLYEDLRLAPPAGCEDSVFVCVGSRARGAGEGRSSCAV